MQELFRSVELRMKQTVDHLHDELKRLRTGRASITLLDGVTVDYYGAPTPLNQLASLTVADANLLLVQPFDPSQIAAIERAITKANLGLNPANDGRLIRVPVPTLTEERRKELVRKAHDLAETARNGVRQVRREGNDELKTMERDKKISQDQEHRGHDEVQRLHDHYISSIQQALDTKEKDILTL